MRVASVAGQLTNSTVERDLDCAVAEPCLRGESSDRLLDTARVPGSPEAADAPGSEGEAHGAVDAL